MTYLENNYFHSILPDSLEILRKQLIHTKISETLATPPAIVKEIMNSGGGSFCSLTGKSEAQKLHVSFAC